MAREPRNVAFVERPNFVGWTCTDCEWQFQVPLSIEAATEESLKADANNLRDRAFAAHVCASHEEHQSPTVHWLHIPRSPHPRRQ